MSLSTAMLQLVKDLQALKAFEKLVKLERSHSKVTAPDKPELLNIDLIVVTLDVSQYLILVILVKEPTPLNVLYNSVALAIDILLRSIVNS